ncbi:MAG: ferredoxin:thioredoxin reductase [bacterium]|nr:ferredoxin:thioredoxin reductase [bacterium]
MNSESRKKALRYFYQRVVEPLGYKFSPDTELVEFLLEQEVKLEQKHGSPYCPCQGLTKDRERNLRIICPCIPYHREHFDVMKRCWCGLFVHQDVTNPEQLEQISAEEAKRRIADVH